jgi:hypothetical protein
MSAAAMDTPAARRRRRAAIAEHLLAAAPDAAPDIEWDLLDRAPAWLALDASASDRLQCRAGAVLCGAELRLWIDRPRVAAARAAVGERFWKALLARPVALPASPARVGADAPVAQRLQSLGAAVLLATLEAPVLRRAAAPLLAPPVLLDMHPEAARQVLAAVAQLEAAP